MWFRPSPKGRRQASKRKQNGCRRYRAHRTDKPTFKDLNDAIVGLTNCYGAQIYPDVRSLKSRRSRGKHPKTITTALVFRDQKNDNNGFSGTANCKCRNTESVKMLCPHSTRHPTQFRRWSSDYRRGSMAPRIDSRHWDSLKDEQYCKIIIGR